MKHTIQKTLIAAAGLFVMIGFQNCQPYSQVTQTKITDDGSKLQGTTDSALTDSELSQAESGSTLFKRLCSYQLQGAKGAVWNVERYTEWENDCSAETANVVSGNPNAQIVAQSTNFVFDGAPNVVDKQKCTYSFLGANGATWISHRYIAIGASCSGDELGIVGAKNPNARITNIVTNFVHDPTGVGFKNKCVFNFLGEKGATWFSERYIVETANCESERATVMANNPKASITTVEQVDVHDPF